MDGQLFYQSPFERDLQRQQYLTGLQQYQQNQALFPSQLQSSTFRAQQERAMSPFQLRSAAAEAGLGEFRLGQEQALSPFRLRSAASEAGLGELGLQRGQYEFDELKKGAGFRQAEREFGEARFRSQSAFLPQMEALRGGIASRMASRLGVTLPSSSLASSNVPQFPPAYGEPQRINRPRSMY